LRRIISCYNDKIVNAAESFVPELKNKVAFKGDSSAYLSFLDFLKIIEQQELVDMDQHWRPQYYNLMRDSIDYNFIGRVENIGTDFEKVLKAVGASNLPIVNKNKLTTDAKHHKLSDTTDQQHSLVHSIYKEDYKYFKY